MHKDVTQPWLAKLAMKLTKVEFGSVSSQWELFLNILSAAQVLDELFLLSLSEAHDSSQVGKV